MGELTEKFNEYLEYKNKTLEEIIAELEKDNKHYTIFKFTGGYKACWGTVQLRLGTMGAWQVSLLKTYPTLKECLLALLKDTRDIFEIGTFEGYKIHDTIEKTLIEMQDYEPVDCISPEEKSSLTDWINERLKNHFNYNEKYTGGKTLSEMEATIHTVFTSIGGEK